MRILLLKTKINTQIDTLDQFKPNGINEFSSGSQDEKEIVKRLNEILNKEKSTSNAFLKSLSVNFNNKSRWQSSNPLSSEKEEWVVTPLLKKQNVPSPNGNKCIECKYKEGLEEILNMLSVCGFIKKPDSEKSEQEMQPILDSKKQISPTKGKEEEKHQSKDMRIKFTRNNGISHEFYY